jgi:hypothetical protein
LGIAARLKGLARHGLLYAGYGTKPSFLILGAQKAGTTALFAYLCEHPAVVGSTRKELGFFTPEAFVDWPEHPHHDVLCANEWERPLGSRRKRAWYESHYPLPHRMRGKLAFEATPEYLYVPAAAERIHAYRPDMKVIALLREPAERAFAAWTMYSNFGSYRARVYAPRREQRPFAEAVEHELDQLEQGHAPLEPGYVRRGLYAEQLERFLERFGPDQVLILDSARLSRETSEVVNQVCAFLGLSPLAPREWPRVHVGRYWDSPEAVKHVLSKLRAFYAPHNQRLVGLMAQPPSWAHPTPLNV